MTKPLTEKQAWLKIARAYDRLYDRVAHGGLCAAISWFSGEMSHDTKLTMQKKIVEELKLRGRDPDDGFWIASRPNCHRRAALARRFAKEV